MTGIGGPVVARPVRLAQIAFVVLLLVKAWMNAMAPPVGDEAYYSRVGFKMIPLGRADMPGPVDRRRLLVKELTDGAFDNVSGMIRPDWRFAREA